MPGHKQLSHKCFSLTLQVAEEEVLVLACCYQWGPSRLSARRHLFATYRWVHPYTILGPKPVCRYVPARNSHCHAGGVTESGCLQTGCRLPQKASWLRRSSRQWLCVAWVLTSLPHPDVLLIAHRLLPSIGSHGFRHPRMRSKHCRLGVLEAPWPFECDGVYV